VVLASDSYYASSKMEKDLKHNQEFLNFRKNFGQHLQSLRKDKGLSQEELANRINLDRVSVGYLEQGIRSPKLRTLFLIAKVLGVPLKDLLDIK